MKRLLILLIAFAASRCVIVRRDHMCEDPKNKIECEQWKKRYPKEYARYERRIAHNPKIE